ncbi:MAG: hypothetical protein H0U57_12850 [Tatlockia sp.]|nr:hypothetical protein [Tatlockia sp.]
MKTIISMLVGGGLILASSVGFAASSANPKTDMQNGWTCTTNASEVQNSSSTSSEHMKPGSLTKMSKHAMQNCRDCTQITCDYKKP